MTNWRCKSGDENIDLDKIMRGSIFCDDPGSVEGISLHYRQFQREIPSSQNIASKPSSKKNIHIFLKRIS